MLRKIPRHKEFLPSMLWDIEVRQGDHVTQRTVHYAQIFNIFASLYIRSQRAGYDARENE